MRPVWEICTWAQCCVVLLAEERAGSKLVKRGHVSVGSPAWVVRDRGAQGGLEITKFKGHVSRTTDAFEYKELKFRPGLLQGHEAGRGGVWEVQRL